MFRFGELSNARTGGGSGRGSLAAADLAGGVVGGGEAHEFDARAMQIDCFSTLFTSIDLRPFKPRIDHVFEGWAESSFQHILFSNIYNTKPPPINHKTRIVEGTSS
jgi:hypothetical protein